MDFGLFYYCQGRGVAHDQAYHEMLDEIALAESSRASASAGSPSTTSPITPSCPARIS